VHNTRRSSLQLQHRWGNRSSTAYFQLGLFRPKSQVVFPAWLFFMTHKAWLTSSHLNVFRLSCANGTERGSRFLLSLLAAVALEGEFVEDFFSRPFTERFPSRCASTAKIVRSLESTAETQPQLQPALLRLSAMISQCFKYIINVAFRGRWLPLIVFASTGDDLFRRQVKSRLNALL